MNADGPTLADFMPVAAARAGDGDVNGRAGEKLAAGTPIADRAAIVAALKTVYDPEIPVDIWELGLIYDLDIAADGDVAVEMTLTAPACPVAGELPQMVAEAVAGVDGVGVATVRLVWDPPWTQERMSEEARLALDMF
ncbi:MAG: SUF system Fe-S cluster assembly protein [Alphaproteobacteria bacterium]|nr:SUF system Fe-S cluster assembly protein [Alphaproteobacteria bacterium]